MIERQGGRNLRVVLDYEMKKRLYRDLAKLGPGRASSEQKRLVAERTFGSNTKHAMARGLVWTSNSPPVTTGEEIWRKKSALGSPSTPTQKML